MLLESVLPDEPVEPELSEPELELSPVEDPGWLEELSEPLEDESLDVESPEDDPLDELESDELDVSLELDASDESDVVPEL